MKHLWRRGQAQARASTPAPSSLPGAPFLRAAPQKGTEGGRSWSPCLGAKDDELTFPYIGLWLAPPRAQPPGTWLVPGCSSDVAMVTAEGSTGTLPFHCGVEEGQAPALMFGGRPRGTSEPGNFVSRRAGNPAGAGAWTREQVPMEEVGAGGARVGASELAEAEGEMRG